jgi:hypothetical protein
MQPCPHTRYTPHAVVLDVAFYVHVLAKKVGSRGHVSDLYSGGSGFEFG